MRSADQEIEESIRYMYLNGGWELVEDIGEDIVHPSNQDELLEEAIWMITVGSHAGRVGMA